MHNNLVLRVVAKWMIPLIFLFGFYVLMHGEHSPGGGFQAGVILASGFILHALVFGVRAMVAKVPLELLQRLAALGALAYGGLGIATLWLGGNFLEFALLAEDPHRGQFWGILIVELGVGLTVASTILALFLRFATWRPDALETAASRTEETPHV